MQMWAFFSGSDHLATLLDSDGARPENTTVGVFFWQSLTPPFFLSLLITASRQRSRRDVRKGRHREKVPEEPGKFTITFPINIFLKILYIFWIIFAGDQGPRGADGEPHGLLRVPRLPQQQPEEAGDPKVPGPEPAQERADGRLEVNGFSPPKNMIFKMFNGRLRMIEEQGAFFWPVPLSSF